MNLFSFITGSGAQKRNNNVQKAKKRYDTELVTIPSKDKQILEKEQGITNCLQMQIFTDFNCHFVAIYRKKMVCKECRSNDVLQGLGYSGLCKTN